MAVRVSRILWLVACCAAIGMLLLLGREQWREKQAQRASHAAKRGAARSRMNGSLAARIRGRLPQPPRSGSGDALELAVAPQEQPGMPQVERQGLRVLNAIDAPESWVIDTCYLRSWKRNPNLVGKLHGTVTLRSDPDAGGGVVVDVAWDPPRPAEEVSAFMDRLSEKYPDQADLYSRPAYRQDLPMEDDGLRDCIEAGLREIVLPPFDAALEQQIGLDVPCDERLAEGAEARVGAIDLGAEFPWKAPP